MNSDETTLFDPVNVDAVTTEHSIERESLRATLSAHQTSVEELPGVENIVYEWRKQYEDPLVSRTESSYYLRIPRHLWDEFGAALDLTDETLEAVIDVHRRTVADACDVSATPADGVAYIALDRKL